MCTQYSLALHDIIEAWAHVYRLDHSLIPSPPTLSQEETVLWTKSNFLGLQKLLQQCHFVPNLLKKDMDTWVEIKIFSCCKGSASYQSRNFIGPYHFLGISQKKLTSFIWLFLAGRRAQTGHETIAWPFSCSKCLHCSTELILEQASGLASSPRPT